MLKYNIDRSQSYPDINRREERYEICDSIKQIQLKWKGALKATQNMDKGLHKVFKTVVREILEDLPPLRYSGSEVSHAIPEPRNFVEVTKISDYIKKPWLKGTLKEINI